jgi:release factor glutamine methyltransferase
MTVGEAIRDATGWLELSNVSSSRLDAELLLGHVLKRERAWLLAHEERELSPEERQMYAIIVQRRTTRVPLVHLTGKREFYGLELAITPDVLTPRVETEQMVEWAIQHTTKDAKLIDVGTGSGAVAIAIAKHRPDLTITATEVSPHALRIAKINAGRHAVDLELVESDLWSNVDGRYHTVVANLPYLRDDAREELMEEVKYEPDVSLFGGDDGLDIYRALLAEVTEHLEPGGKIFVEGDPWQHELLIKEAAKVGLKPIEQGYFVLGFSSIK